MTDNIKSLEPVAWECSSPAGEKPALAFLTSKKPTVEHYENQGWRVLPLYAAPVDDKFMNVGLSTETVDNPVQSVAAPVADSAEKSPASEGGEAGGTGVSWEHTAPARSSVGGRIQVSNVSDSAMAKWISVDDRLPNDLDTVIVFRPDAHHLPACDPNIDVRTYFGNGVFNGIHKVTHWMPLPKEPIDAAIAASAQKGDKA